MKKIGMTCLAGLFLLSLSTECAAKQWSLRDCIDYALANNIQLQKAKIKEYSALEDVKQSQAALLPSLNLSTLGQLDGVERQQEPQQREVEQGGG